ncbi:hypothetical protein KAI87_06055 [Myxococcota bacterium]|nr:hypothetical protein [Myxococcota bacterium]
MNIVLLIGILLGTAASPQAAQQAEEPATLFVRAAGDYDAGEHKKAAQGFQKLIDAGYANSHVLYNAGGAQLRAGNTGLAIAAWLQAQNLAPRDQDITANLSFARTKTTDDIHYPPPSEALRTLFFWHYGMSLGELYVTLLFTNLFLWAFVLIWRLWWQRARWIAVGFLALSLALGSSVLIRESSPTLTAVVTQPTLEAFSGTSVDAVKRFTVHEGAELRFKEKRGEWLRVVLPNNEEGWLRQNGVVQLTLK